MNINISIQEKLSAFGVFKRRGISAIEQAYPQLLDFIKENQYKSLAQVRDELVKSAHEQESHLKRYVH